MAKIFPTIVSRDTGKFAKYLICLEARPGVEPG